jgi:hypothetical protein
MTALIAMECERYFRWFDIGDIQDMDHLEKIVQIAKNLPWIKFWLPTQEKTLVKKLDWIPANLTIRVSGAIIGGSIPDWPTTATVITATKSKWAELVEDGTHCPAPLQGNKCLDCRKCWSRYVKNVVYRKH